MCVGGDSWRLGGTEEPGWGGSPQLVCGIPVCSAFRSRLISLRIFEAFLERREAEGKKGSFGLSLAWMYGTRVAPFLTFLRIQP